MEVTLPALLKLEAYHRVGGGHKLTFIPKPLYDQALRFATSVGVTHINAYQLSEDFEYYYVNSSPSNTANVSELRCRKLRDSLNGDNSAFFKDRETIIKYCTGIEEVVINRTHPDYVLEGNSCTCDRFWQMRCCEHLIAVLAHKETINIGNQLAPAYPKNAPMGRKNLKALRRGRGARTD